MTQSTTLKILKNNKKRWFTTKEIVEELGITSSSVSSNLNKLYNQGIIHKSSKKTGYRDTNIWRIK